MSKPQPMAKKVTAVIKLALQAGKPTLRRRWALPSVSTG